MEEKRQERAREASDRADERRILDETIFKEDKRRQVRKEKERAKNEQLKELIEAEVC